MEYIRINSVVHPSKGRCNPLEGLYCDRIVDTSFAFYKLQIDLINNRCYEKASRYCYGAKGLAMFFK